jgi:hypothetical protein
MQADLRRANATYHRVNILQTKLHDCVACRKLLAFNNLYFSVDRILHVRILLHYELYSQSRRYNHRTGIDLRDFYKCARGLKTLQIAMKFVSCYHKEGVPIPMNALAVGMVYQVLLNLPKHVKVQWGAWEEIGPGVRLIDESMYNSIFVKRQHLRYQ